MKYNDNIKRMVEEFNEEHGNLINTGQGGNGYHGNCSICKLALVTDLGYSSWEGTKCTKREWVHKDLPKEVLSYIRYKGLVLIKRAGNEFLVKPYTEERYTILDIIRHFNNL